MLCFCFVCLFLVVVFVLVLRAFLLYTFFHNGLSFCRWCIFHSDSLLGSCWEGLGWICIRISSNLVFGLIAVSVICPFFVVCFVFVVCCCVLRIVLLIALVGICLVAICLGWPIFVGFLGLFLWRGHIVVFRLGHGLLITGLFGFLDCACLEWRWFSRDWLLSLPNCKLQLFALFLSGIFPVFRCVLTSLCGGSFGGRCL